MVKNKKDKRYSSWNSHQYCLILGFARGLLIQSFQLMPCGLLEGGSSGGVRSEGRPWGSCKQSAWWPTSSSLFTVPFNILSALKEVLYFLESTSASHRVYSCFLWRRDLGAIIGVCIPDAWGACHSAQGAAQW